MGMSCKIEDIPEVDAVVISHNHYDHLDTISTLFRRARLRHVFAPLGNKSPIYSIGYPRDTCIHWICGGDTTRDVSEAECTPA
ncbi:hypothetical protein ARMSODRAFT_202695 [Armillaria solidipes]|uniref:Metallo-beta-lactamase domain-containing protein n=1 Tax=Armillaria solidipes TaxID=1076256 RepID=A0A2H3BQS2_9AGAR|nr:hypothetical protein ARMSODRAFT_202695 [Armillaria solidipes]